MSNGFALRRATLVPLAVVALLTGCASGNSILAIDSDWDQDSSELISTTTEITTGCQEAGGLRSSCECIAEWIVRNISVSEVSFGENPPSTGKWIYVGGNLYIPGQYEDDFRRCMQ